MLLQSSPVACARGISLASLIAWTEPRPVHLASRDAQFLSFSRIALKTFLSLKVGVFLALGGPATSSAVPPLPERSEMRGAYRARRRAKSRPRFRCAQSGLRSRL